MHKAQCFGTLEDDHCVYLLMELITGGEHEQQTTTLKCFIGEFFKYLVRKRALAEKDARFYAANVMLMLEHLHELKIMYRDLKPEVC